PEQVLGLPITTATDVFALGVILYRLLTGHLPHRPALDREDAIRLAAEASIRPPSVAGAEDGPVADESREMRGDIDNIVLRALARGGNDRYASVAELGDDLLRFLENRPVRAIRPSWTYRARKALRRHRWSFGLAAMLLGIVLTGLGGFAWQASEIREQRDLLLEQKGRLAAETERSLNVTEALADFIVDAEPVHYFFDLGDLPVPPPPDLIIAQERLESRLAETTSIIHSRLLGALGLSFLRHGRDIEARDLFRQSLASWPTSSADAPHTQQHDLAFVEIQLSLASALGGEQAEEKEALLFDVLGAAQNGIAPELEARGLLELSRFRLEERRTDDAVSLAEEAVAVAQASELLESQLYVEALKTLGDHLRRAGNSAQALRWLEEALPAAEEVFGNESYEAASALAEIGVNRLETGDFTGASEALKTALSHREFAGQHTYAVPFLELKLAEALANQQEWEGAKDALKRSGEALAILSLLKAQRTGWALTSPNALSDESTYWKRFVASLHATTQGFRSSAGAPRLTARQIRSQLARVQLLVGQIDQAIVTAENVGMGRDHGPEDLRATSEALLVGAIARLQLGARAEGSQLIDQLSTVLEQAPPNDPELVAMATVVALWNNDREEAQLLIEELRSQRHRDSWLIEPCLLDGKMGLCRRLLFDVRPPVSGRGFSVFSVSSPSDDRPSTS
ncbi:MAG: tetratricopeptide repeat protein, partial [Acidobacteriota bacterium]